MTYDHQNPISCWMSHRLVDISLKFVSNFLSQHTQKQTNKSWKKSILAEVNTTSAYINNRFGGHKKSCIWPRKCLSGLKQTQEQTRILKTGSNGNDDPGLYLYSPQAIQIRGWSDSVLQLEDFTDLVLHLQMCLHADWGHFQGTLEGKWCRYWRYHSFGNGQNWQCHMQLSIRAVNISKTIFSSTLRYVFGFFFILRHSQPTSMATCGASVILFTSVFPCGVFIAPFGTIILLKSVMPHCFQILQYVHVSNYTEEHLRRFSLCLW